VFAPNETPSEPSSDVTLNFSSRRVSNIVSESTRIRNTLIPNESYAHQHSLDTDFTLDRWQLTQDPQVATLISHEPVGANWKLCKTSLSETSKKTKKTRTELNRPKILPAFPRSATTPSKQRRPCATKIPYRNSLAPVLRVNRLLRAPTKEPRLNKTTHPTRTPKIAIVRRSVWTTV